MSEEAKKALANYREAEKKNKKELREHRHSPKKEVSTCVDMFNPRIVSEKNKHTKRRNERTDNGVVIKLSEEKGIDR